MIPATSSILSLLALKLVAMRRVSHVYELAADPAAGLFAGLGAIPKATSLTDYSYRTDHRMQAGLLKGLGGALTVLRDAGYSDLEALRWLLTEDATIAARPVDAMAAGRVV